MSNLPSCEICGGNRYEKRSGFYICTECNTQSQDIREETFDAGVLGFRENQEEEREVITGEVVQQERSLTSWECHNFILKGLVEELINLGAPEEIKKVAFQIWAQYLKNVGAAFISKHKGKLPRLPFAFKNKDAEILYGLSKLRQKIFKHKRPRSTKSPDYECTVDSSEQDSSSGTESRRSSSYLKSTLRRKQRKLAKSELSMDAASEITETSLQDLDSSRLSKKSTRIKVSFSKTAVKKVKIARRLSQSEAEEEAEQSELEQEVASSSIRRKKGDLLSCLTMTVIVAILILALYVTHSDIQIADVMRWIIEDRLSVHKPQTFLKKQTLLPNVLLFDCTCHGMKDDVRYLAHHLGVSVPTPDIYKLIERYCKELNLPDDYKKVVYSVMMLHPPKMKFSLTGKNCYLPDFESRSIAFIIFVAKLLFGLDDVTENEQSKFIGSLNEQENEGNKHFCWKRWVQHIECRKVTLAKYDPAFDLRHFDRRLSDPRDFLRYWDKAKYICDTTAKLKDHGVDPVFTQTLKSSVSKFANSDQEISNTISFPLSLTPQYTNLQHLLTNYPKLIPERARSVLTEDFSRHRIDYFLNGAEEEIDIDIDDITPQIVKFIKKTFKLSPFSHLNSTTCNIPAYKPVRFTIIKDEEQQEKSRKLKLKPFDATVLEESEPEPKSEPVNLKRPVKHYWLHHHIDKRSTIGTVEKIVQSALPCSFYWLLKQCANVINADVRDIYRELTVIECTLIKKFVDEKYKNTLLTCNSSDW